MSELKRRPLNGRVLVEPINNEEKKTAAGVILPTIVKKGNLLRGIVVLVDDVAEKIKLMEGLLTHVDKLPEDSVRLFTENFLRLVNATHLKVGEIVYFKTGVTYDIILDNKIYHLIRTMDLELADLQ